MEIQLNKLRALFPALFTPMIQPPPPHTLSGTRFAQIIGGDRARKRARSLFNCISVTDGIKINEQNNPLAKGPLYVQTEFGAIPKVRASLNILGYRMSLYWHEAYSRPQNVHYHR